MRGSRSAGLTSHQITRGRSPRAATPNAPRQLRLGIPQPPTLAHSLECRPQERELGVILRSSRGLVAADDVGERGDRHAHALTDLEQTCVAAEIVLAARGRGLEDKVELARTRRHVPASTPASISASSRR